MNKLDYQNTGYVSSVVGTIITGGSLDALIGHLAVIQGICRWRIYPSEWVDENDQSTGSRPSDSQSYEDIKITECQSITRGFTLSRVAIDWVPGIRAGINYLDIRRKDYAERRGGSRYRTIMVKQ